VTWCPIDDKDGRHEIRFVKTIASFEASRQNLCPILSHLMNKICWGRNLCSRQENVSPE
jgi:hypothetical protein